VPEYVIVGGGPAGHSAARTLREEGAQDILLLSRDPDPPYDRTAVTKGYLRGECFWAPWTASTCGSARA
jgi:NADPH-dependent 2,4-dienoyl-CoA reductase/sulfur reductase-like enzyme